MNHKSTRTVLSLKLQRARASDNLMDTSPKQFYSVCAVTVRILTDEVVIRMYRNEVLRYACALLSGPDAV
jgi:hypothetical protein